MVSIILEQDNFINNRFSYPYEDREILFTIVDEEFEGHNRIGKLNRMNILVTNTETGEAKLHSSVIGLGDTVVGVRTDVPELRGKLLNKDNMHLCVVEIYDAQSD